MSTDVAAPAAPAPERHYGFSALLSGFARMWRGWKVVLPVVLVNAAVQGLLIVGDPVPARSLSFAVLAAVSFVVIALSFALVTSSALEAVDGRVTWSRAVDRVQEHGGAFLLWFVALLLAMAVGFVLRVVPGLLVVLVTPYLLLAVLAGRGALGANFRAIGARWGRWLVTALLMGVVVSLSWVFAALSAFFVTGWPSAVICWVWFGLLAAWFQTTWALVFRSTPAGAAD